MRTMRSIGAAFIATTLVVSSAFAAGNAAAPLSPGKPAGVKEAAVLGPSAFVILMGMGIVIGGVVLSVSNNCCDGVTTPTTTGTSGTGLP